MDRRYLNRLLREAAEDPGKLARCKKFWKSELFSRYLRRCDDVLYGDPSAGLAFTKPAPELAARIAEVNPGANDVSGVDLMLLAYSYLGSAYRRTDDYERAEAAFDQAHRYRKSASPTALAEHLRRLAYFRMVQKKPEVFSLISEAIALHKRGNLVRRHALGECLLCRGHAYVMFDQHGKSFDDWTAALNHISLKIDPKPYYCALHNLAVLAVDFGSDEEMHLALENLKPAQVILNSYWGRPFAKLKLRWLIAVIHARLGAQGRAELVYREVRDGLVDLKLAYEVGMLSIDLACLYLAQGRHEKLEALVRETAAIFRRLGVEPKAQEALNIWRQAKDVTEDLLKRVRGIFASQTVAMPAIAA